MDGLSVEFWIVWGCCGWVWGLWWLGWALYYRWIGTTKVNEALEKLEMLRKCVGANDAKMVG